MNRRTFFQVLGATPFVGPILAQPPPLPSALIRTVRGPITAADLGLTLTHEHVLVDFIGAAEVSPSRYDPEVVFAAARPHLARAYERGARALFECTPAFLGRDARLLRRLSEATGLHLVTNTGLYGARKNVFLPPYALTESAETLAARWIAEARDGVDGTGILPGFVKCGVDPEPTLSSVHAKLVDAAAETHLETGLTVAIHTGRGPGIEILERLRRRGVGAEAFIWVHAQNASDDHLATAAERGAWLGFDGLNAPTLTRHLHLCVEMKRRGLLHRVLVSHDAGWFDPAKPNGGTFRPYETLFTEFIPLLRAKDFSEPEITQLLTVNPAAAYTVKVRRS